MHTGEVYLNGKAMYEAVSLESVINPVVYQESWDPDFTVYQWYTRQEGGYTEIYANFRARIQTRRQWKSTSAEIASIRIKQV